MRLAKIAVYTGFLACLGVLILLGQPLYWWIYAEYIYPFTDKDQAKLQVKLSRQQDNTNQGAVWKTLRPSLPFLSLPKQPYQKGQSKDGQKGDEGAEMNWEVNDDVDDINPDKQCITLQFTGQTRNKDDIKPEEYPLTKECMSLYADNSGYIIVTWANLHYLEFVMNWIWHWHQIGITTFVVGAMDDDILKILASSNFPTFAMSTGMTTKDFGWGTPDFHKMGRQKISLIKTFLEFDLKVIISDVDCIWLRDPRPFFDKYPQADILSSSDYLGNTVDDESLEKWPEAGAAANIGIMLLRPGALQLVTEWVDRIEKDDKVWDQNAFNDLFRRGNKPVKDDPHHIFLAYDGKLKMGILPVSVFCSGHTYHVQKMPQRLGLEPYVVHNDFQFSGMQGKRHRFRETLLWNDGPGYFDWEQGYLAYDLDLPEEMKQGSKPLDPATTDISNVEGHFKMVNHQLVQLRNAFAIGQLLNRFVVLPELWCGLDRWWAPHKGTIPGSKFQLPFQCPLDHVLDLEKAVQGLNTNEFGPDTLFTEYSLFQNPRMTNEVKNDEIVVKVVTPGTEGCSNGSTPAELQDEGKSICVWEGLNDLQTRTAIQSVRQHKVLRYQNMMTSFSRHAADSDWEAFKKRMAQYGSLWCCVQAHPGHIHYDLLWDVVPHTDKFGRTWDQEWKIVTGP